MLLYCIIDESTGLYVSGRKLSSNDYSARLPKFWVSETWAKKWIRDHAAYQHKVVEVEVNVKN